MKIDNGFSKFYDRKFLSYLLTLHRVRKFTWMRPSVDATSQDTVVHEEISTGDSRGNLNEVS